VCHLAFLAGLREALDHLTTDDQYRTRAWNLAMRYVREQVMGVVDTMYSMGVR
jgi:hypothetical protein